MQASPHRIVKYIREGDRVTAHYVQGKRQWPADMSRFRRESMPGLPPGPLCYGRADLLAAGVIKPAGHTFEHLPFLSLQPAR